MLATSVIRGAEPGSTHGGIYRVDLETGDHQLVRAWDEPLISWDGRGGERGLRGIASTASDVWAASTKALLRLDPESLATRAVYEHPHLGNNHEIAVDGDFILLNSTAFDRVVRFGISTARFVESTRLAKHPLTLLRGIGPLAKRAGQEWIQVTGVDGDPDFEPIVSDTCHLNSVRAIPGGFEVAGTSMRHLVRVRGRRARLVARLPRGTHNAQFDGSELVYNDTRRGRVVIRKRKRRVEMAPPDPVLRPGDEMPESAVATPNFCRGLLVLPDILVGGSSPATVTAYDRGSGVVLRSVQLTDVVAHAVHGLTLAPDTLSESGAARD